jgi:hypothetical protein
MKQERTSLIHRQIQEVSQVKHSLGCSIETQAGAMKYCDRCARRSIALFYDDLTLQELCQECCERLRRKREMAPRRVGPKV